MLRGVGRAPGQHRPPAAQIWIWETPGRSARRHGPPRPLARLPVCAAPPRRRHALDRDPLRAPRPRHPFVPERPASSSSTCRTPANLRCLMYNSDYSSAIRALRPGPIAEGVRRNSSSRTSGRPRPRRGGPVHGGEAFLVPEYPGSGTCCATHNPDVRCCPTITFDPGTAGSSAPSASCGSTSTSPSTASPPPRTSGCAWRGPRHGDAQPRPLRRLCPRGWGPGSEGSTTALMPQNHEGLRRAAASGPPRTSTSTCRASRCRNSPLHRGCVDDPDPGPGELHRLAAEVLPQLARNAPVFEEHRRMQAITSRR